MGANDPLEVAFTEQPTSAPSSIRLRRCAECGAMGALYFRCGACEEQYQREQRELRSQP